MSIHQFKLTIGSMYSVQHYEMKHHKLDYQFMSYFYDPPFRAAWRTFVRHASVHNDEPVEKATTD